MSTALRPESAASNTAENARQRDLDKHYQPWLDARTPISAVPGDTGPDGAAMRCSPDTALTAFAQLAALRLNVKRGMVSLIETQTQIVLAEATQSVSLVDGSRHAPDDHVCLGNVTLPRADCMDEHALKSSTLFHDSEGQEVQLPAFIVPDTLEDDRFKHHPYVTSGLSVRFYAGVPIMTKQGHAIGAYAVSDTKPRPDGLTLEEVRFMTDVAKLIADHLDRVMGSSFGRVSERDFMRGISYFLEDLSEYKFKVNNAHRSKTSSSAHGSDIRATDSQAMPPRGRQAHRGALPNISVESPAKQSRGPHTTLNIDQVPQYSRDHVSPPGDSPDSSKNNIRRIFAQASQLICEQANATGCLFTDAVSSQPAECIVPIGSVDSRASASTTISPADEQELENTDTPPYATTPSESEATHGDTLDDFAEVLSLTLTEGCDDNVNSGIVYRQSLKKCISRYPFGRCFYLDAGRMISGESVAVDESVTGGGSHRQTTPHQDLLPLALPPEVLKRIPNAKWLIFLPLFNYSQSQWCAAGFIWGNDFKMGDPDDALPYFKTFGSCMMSEVASMEVMNTNLAKSTFIASISHDLRSPLHGVLGNLEFLGETLTTAYQMSLSAAMETCGKTLLDTIDHLLDYAKINDIRRGSLSQVKKRSRDDELSGLQDPLTTTFDLSSLLEEVVEAVFAGQTFRKTNIRHYDAVDEACEQISEISLDSETSLDEQIHNGSAKFSGKVFLVMNIEKRSWNVRGHTGALRRVVMNVVGNAIKYCRAGCIEISLKAKEVASSGLDVEFIVKDTGIGMSEDFLTNHLFKAFSQENSFTAGTGLGLSITSQIVSHLRGRIRVASEKDVGTHVHITLPLQVAPTPLDAYTDRDMQEAVQCTTDKKVAILNPLRHKGDHTTAQFLKLESSLSSMFNTWFGMEVLRCEAMRADLDASVYIYAEPPPIDHLVEHHFNRERNGHGVLDTALLIVCTNAFEAAALRAAGVDELTSLGSIIEVVSQPVGVRKMARVLLQCLRRLEDVKTSAGKGHGPVSLSSPDFASREARKEADRVEWNASAVVYEPMATQHRPSINTWRWKSDQPDHHRSSMANLRAASHISALSVEQSSEPPAMAQVVEQAKPENSPRVLLVDDNAINLKLLVTFMKKMGLSYAEAINGLEALDKVKGKGTEEPFDVVLMDLQMPVMDGLESTRQIREWERQNGLRPARIIAITGVGSEVARQEAMDAGMSEFMTKPVRLKLLWDLILNDP